MGRGERQQGPCGPRAAEVGLPEPGELQRLVPGGHPAGADGGRRHEAQRRQRLRGDHLQRHWDAAGIRDAELHQAASGGPPPGPGALGADQRSHEPLCLLPPHGVSAPPAGQRLRLDLPERLRGAGGAHPPAPRHL